MSKKFKAMKFWIDGDVVLGERVYELLCSMGYRWWTGGKYSANDGFCVGGYTTNESGNIDWHSVRDKDCFEDEEGAEINIDWMRTPKEETVELNGKKYLKRELEEALKKLNPVD